MSESEPELKPHYTLPRMLEDACYVWVRPNGEKIVYRQTYPAFAEPHDGHSTRLIWWEQDREAGL